MFKKALQIPEAGLLNVSLILAGALDVAKFIATIDSNLVTL
jgi:hypothetical protein